MIPVLSRKSSHHRVVAAGSGGSSYSSLITGHASLLAYWRLGESSGTSAVDSKNGHNGTYGGSYTLGQTSLITGDADTSVAFSSSTGKVTVPHASWMDLTNNFTMECWIKFSSFSTDNALFSRGYDGSAIAYLIDHNDGAFPNKLRMGSYPLSINNPGATSLSTGVKYHVMAVFGSTTWTLYLNGVSDMSMSSPGAIPTGSTDLGIGFMPGLGRNCNAVMDEVAIYNAALTSTDAAAHYAAGM
jgi:hypothetical protein